MRVLLDVSAVPDRPVGAGVYTLAIARGLDADRGLELHLSARRDDEDRWRAVTPNATVHADAPPRRPVRLAWEQVGAPKLASSSMITSKSFTGSGRPLDSETSTTCTSMRVRSM